MPQGPFLRKYGVEAKINFALFEVDGVDLRIDAVDAGTDCSIMKDEGDEATCTNDFVDEGKGYSLTLTSTEMEAARIVIYVVDSATKAWLDDSIVIETYGHASAMHAMDLDTPVPTVAEIQTEMEEDGASILDTISDLLPASTIAAATDIPAMVGTDNAALASVVGAIDDAAANGDPTEVDTLMKYIKQLINILIGTTGIVAFPAEGAPANNISLAEVIRAIHADVTGLNGDVMVGTNGANTTVPDAAGTAPTAVEIQAEMEEDGASLLDTIRDELANETDGLSALKTLLDAIPTTAMRGTDNGALATVCTEARLAVLADWINDGRLDLLLDAIKAKTDDLAFTGGNVHAHAKAEDNIDFGVTKKASINAEVVDTLNVDTYIEPGQEVPAATNTLAKKISYLFKLWRNKKDQDGSKTQYYADDGSTVDQKRTTSEADGTVTDGEVASGP